MNCQTCIQECKERGGLCVAQSSLTVKEQLHVEALGNEAVEATRIHQERGHAMTLHGALWRCGVGHEVDATPVETMRAAGIPRLL